ncbi:MAG: phosphosulfolactate synthase [Bacteroidales bacterium]|nr:phosphosulfolactate synthase [Bacteroidales bacterium]
MNFQLPYIPERSGKPRNEGLTMMMDKGLSLKEVESFIESSGEYTDYVKFGFGTSVITNKLKEKLKLYREANIRPYFGGTLFEVFVIRNMFDDYKRFISDCGLDLAEVSDGSMSMPHNEKLEYIRKLSKDVTVISEVGSKQRGVFIPANEWVSMMKTELEAGSLKVIAEARESGTIGIYNSDGSANEALINTISSQINPSDILWEAPNGKQQVWFIKLYGANVNLGNIATNGVIPLECLRLGLRGDTFFDSLPKEEKGKKQSPYDYIPYFDFQI